MAITTLAIIRFTVGSCYGQAATEKDAVANAFRVMKSDFGSLGKLKKDAVITAYLYDYRPYSNIHWDGQLTFGKREDNGETETIQPYAKVVMDAKGKITDRVTL